MLFSNNYIQRIAFFKASNVVSGTIHKQISKWTDYLSLAEQNQLLQEENAELRNKLQAAILLADTSRTQFPPLWAETWERDTTNSDLKIQRRYTYIPAKVINNSVNKQHNYITIDRGAKSGVEEDMAVMGPDGLVGIVYGVSEQFATVMPIINRHFKVSAKLKKNNHFGSLAWDGRSYRYATLNEISLHVPVSKGDTIVVSGFSGNFPEGLLIGTINKIEPKDGSFFNIEVLLTTDFRKLYTVTVVDDILKKEQRKLEQQILDEE